MPVQPCIAKAPVGVPAPPLIAADAAGSRPTILISRSRVLSASETPISDPLVPIPWQKAVTRPSVCSQISRPSCSRWPGTTYGLLNWSVA